MARLIALALPICLLATRAGAHASEGGFILLLPTTFFIIGGAVSVFVTVLLVLFLPASALQALFRPFSVSAIPRWPGPAVPSTLSFIAMLALITAGFTGSHDPNRNPLPMAIWTLLWVLLFVIQGLFGNLWRFLNPWSGPYAVLTRLGLRPVLSLRADLGHWIGWICFLAFAAVLLAHPAPKDPERLALMVACYWSVHFMGMVLCGPVWLRRAEGLSVALDAYARVAVTSWYPRGLKLGFPGFRSLALPSPSISLAIFMITLLAVGSFDGLNETFWWMGLIGVNPLEFPGRSGLVWQTLGGLALSIVALIAIFWAVIWLGARLARAPARSGEMFRAQAPALLPIALGYHVGHYFSGFLIDIQYVAEFFCKATDLCHVIVTAGSFNQLSSVRMIWLTQAGAVVLGHICAIMLSHAISLRVFHGRSESRSHDHRRALLSHLPLSIMMVAYTIFGLWLLAAPRGV